MTVMNAIPDIEDYADRYQSALAAELRAERARQELTVEAIAKHADMQTRTVSRYMNGDRDIPFTRLRAMCDALDIDPINLMRLVEQRISKL